MASSFAHAQGENALTLCQPTLNTALWVSAPDGDTWLLLRGGLLARNKKAHTAV